MCTSILEIVETDGMGKGGEGWIDLTHAVVSYDHPHYALFEDAITIDFVNKALGPGSRVAVEISLEAAKGLAAALQRAITQADYGGRGGYDDAPAGMK
jgi:Family of unknown function (DUF6295)